VPVRLPGVGTQLDVRDEEGRLITAIRRVDGHVELYQGERAVARLDEASADALGAFLSGHIVMPPELASRMADVLGGLELDWVRLPAGAHATGRTIGELEVRRRTGVTVLAVLRGSVPIVAVDAGTVLQAGDELVYTGRRQDSEVFRSYVVRGA
jgi:TrkA domain protein